MDAFDEVEVGENVVDRTHVVAAYASVLTEYLTDRRIKVHDYDVQNEDVQDAYRNEVVVAAHDTDSDTVAAPFGEPFGVALVAVVECCILDWHNY